MSNEFILVPGRSSRQGVTLNEGKYTDGYKDETSTLRMNPSDMTRLSIAEGDTVRMWNDVGSVEVPVIDAKDECPVGLVFICYGDKSSQLMGGETHGSGMPDSKGLDVFIERTGSISGSNAADTVSISQTPALKNHAGQGGGALDRVDDVPRVDESKIRVRRAYDPEPDSSKGLSSAQWFMTVFLLIMLLWTIFSMAG